MDNCRLHSHVCRFTLTNFLSYWLHLKKKKKRGKKNEIPALEFAGTLIGVYVCDVSLDLTLTFLLSNK